MGQDVIVSGVLYDKLSRTSRAVVLIGTASTDGPGGPPGGGGPGEPPGIWGGPIDPYPGHPLPNPPPGIWPGPRPPHPAHPIVNPPAKPPEGPPVDPPVDPPTVDWSWCWNPNYGWLPAYVAGDKPQPPPVGGPAKK